MEHRALALAYRPQSFAEVAGQHHVTAVLSRALSKGRIHACYLFSGPRGVGKTTTARILAKILNCPNAKDGVPCNACEVCREITAGASLDVQEIDGASNRGIADVQQLREKVRFTPSGGRYRVVIIDEVHQLSGDAFAALLKTLEEPPPHVVFVFATTDPLKLPDTIRSRCQRYDFGRLPLSAVVARLKEIAAGESKRGERIALHDEAAFLLARRAEGSMRDAVSALDQVLSTGVTTVDEKAVTEVLGLVSREIFHGLGERILAGDPVGALAALHAAYRDGVDPRDLAEGLLEHLRGVLVLRLDPGAQDLVSAGDEERRRLEEQGKAWDTPDLLRHLRIVTEAQGAMRDSAQPLAHLELAVVEMASLEPGVRLADILDKLGVLSGDGGEGEKPVPRKAPAARPPAGGGRRASAAPAAAASAAGSATGSAASSAASSAAGSAAGVAPGSDPRWAEAVRRIKESKLMVGVFLDESRVHGWQGSVLLVSADDVHQSFLSKAENRELIESTLAAVYGRPARVRFVNGNSAAPAPVESPVAEAAPAKEGEEAAVPVAAGAAVAADAAGAPNGEASAAAARGAAEHPAARRARLAAVTPMVERAMVLFDADIVKQSGPGGTGR
jgi:DNA polymerase-3 subunit gamma/tau